MQTLSLTPFVAQKSKSQAAGSSTCWPLSMHLWYSEGISSVSGECRMQDVHARRVVAMAERIHAGLPVDTDNPPSGPQR